MVALVRVKPRKARKGVSRRPPAQIFISTKDITTVAALRINSYRPNHTNLNPKPNAARQVEPIHFLENKNSGANSWAKNSPKYFYFAYSTAVKLRSAG
jgi:hypothetical protein